MTRFPIDHVVIRTPDAEGLAGWIAEACGLAILRGWAPGGDVTSRGVRFANGPFLDIFAAPEPGCSLVLGGELAAVEIVAAARGWATRLVRREARPPEGPDFPWSMALFRRGQGLLTTLSVIDYARDDPLWATPEFSGGLYAPASAAGARLQRVWLGAADLARAQADLEALGCAPSGALQSAFAPFSGVRMAGPAADLVLSAGEDGVLRIDLETGRGGAAELAWPGAPVFVLNDALAS